MSLVRPYEDTTSAGRRSRWPTLCRLALSMGILTILLGFLLFSIFRRSTVTKTMLPLQMANDFSQVTFEESKFSSDSQSSRAAPVVAVGDLVFAESEKVWMHNYEGELLVTRDAGKSWLQVGGDKPKDFDAFTMINGNQGWAVENENKIWKTDDGGQTWRFIGSLPQSPDLNYAASKIVFNGDVDGWVIGLFSLWRTRDAGLTWHEVEELSYSGFKNRVRDLYFLDSRIGWAICEKGLVMQTKDGGDHWRSVVDSLRFNFVTTVNAARFLDENRGWISVSDAPNPFPDNVVLSTIDGGKTWRQQKNFGGNATIYDIYFLDDKRGWIVGGIKQGDSQFETGMLFRTDDSGQTWRKIKTPPDVEAINSVRFTSADEGWLAAVYSIYRTHDGGESWTTALSYPEVKRRNEEILDTK